MPVWGFVLGWLGATFDLGQVGPTAQRSNSYLSSCFSSCFFLFCKSTLVLNSSFWLVTPLLQKPVVWNLPKAERYVKLVLWAHEHVLTWEKWNLECKEKSKWIFPPKAILTVTCCNSKLKFTLVQYLIPLVAVTLVHSMELWGTFPDGALLSALPLSPWQCVLEFKSTLLFMGCPMEQRLTRMLVQGSSPCTILQAWPQLCDQRSAHCCSWLQHHPACKAWRALWQAPDHTEILPLSSALPLSCCCWSP